MCEKLLKVSGKWLNKSFVLGGCRWTFISEIKHDLQIQSLNFKIAYLTAKNVLETAQSIILRNWGGLMNCAPNFWLHNLPLNVRSGCITIVEYVFGTKSNFVSVSSCIIHRREFGWWCILSMETWKCTFGFVTDFNGGNTNSFQYDSHSLLYVMV